MKTCRKLAVIAGLAALAYSANGYALNVEGSGSNIAVSFRDSAQFTDIETRGKTASPDESRVLKEVREAFHKASSKYLPNGYALEIEVNDIDLAGDMSQLTSPFGDHRVVTDVFPPRIVFHYTVYGPGEQVVASGNANLTDLAFHLNSKAATFHSDKAAPYVTELIHSWASKDLRRAVKTK